MIKIYIFNLELLYIEIDYYLCTVISHLKIFFRFIKFYFKATTIYNVHSPFVFEFIEEVLLNRKKYGFFAEFEKSRKSLLKDNTPITKKDYGAGSHSSKSLDQNVAYIAKNALSKKRKSQILFYITNLYKPKTILEFGSSLGISTLYQAYGSPNAKFVSMEGDPSIAKVASKLFLQYYFNIELSVGEFNTILDKCISNLGTLDYVFFDGNHRKEPTLLYFRKCLEYKNNNSVFVFDDIYWSDEMNEAWEIIKKHEDVRLSIDLFDLGIVFFNEDFHIKQDFKIINQKFKPWSFGFFG